MIGAAPKSITPLRDQALMFLKVEHGTLKRSKQNKIFYLEYRVCCRLNRQSKGLLLLTFKAFIGGIDLVMVDKYVVVVELCASTQKLNWLNRNYWSWNSRIRLMLWIWLISIILLLAYVSTLSKLLTSPSLDAQLKNPLIWDLLERYFQLSRVIHSKLVH